MDSNLKGTFHCCSFKVYVHSYVICVSEKSRISSLHPNTSISASHLYNTRHVNFLVKSTPQYPSFIAISGCSTALVEVDPAENGCQQVAKITHWTSHSFIEHQLANNYLFIFWCRQPVKFSHGVVLITWMCKLQASTDCWGNISLVTLLRSRAEVM